MITTDPLNLPGDVLAPRIAIAAKTGRVGVLGNGDRLFVTRADLRDVIFHSLNQVGDLTDPIDPETLGDLQGVTGGEFADFAAILAHIGTKLAEMTERRFAALQKRYDAATEALLNKRADAWGYFSLSRATTYAASTNPHWAAEAAALIAHRDEVWIAAFNILQAVRGGAAIPLLADYLAALPAAPVRPTV